MTRDDHIAWRNTYATTGALCTIGAIWFALMGWAAVVFGGLGCFVLALYHDRRARRAPTPEAPHG